MTRYGFQKAKEQLAQLKGSERQEVIHEVAKARALGDLSENAEYDSAKEKQRILESRIATLSELIEKVTVVDVARIQSDKIEFGATVTLEDDDTGKVATYQIVGDAEADIDQGLISIESPLAKGLLGKQAEEEVEIHIGDKVKNYYISAITFVDHNEI